MPKAHAPITLVLAEASVELVPRQLRGHSSVIVNAKRQGRDPARVLLDSSFHHRAMRGRFLRAPKLSDVPYPVQMEPNLVVEFYSR